jgi:hypothetical protein
MVLNTTFNNISIISWWPVSLVEETGVPGEKKENFVLKQHQKKFYNFHTGLQKILFIFKYTKLM